MGRGVKAVISDSHFWVPFAVLLAGIGLLVVFHLVMTGEHTPGAEPLVDRGFERPRLKPWLT